MYTFYAIKFYRKGEASWQIFDTMSRKLDPLVSHAQCMMQNGCWDAAFIVAVEVNPVDCKIMSQMAGEEIDIKKYGMTPSSAR